MDESEHRIAEQERILAIIETPCHFVEVGLQMLRRDFMPCADDAALQEREGRLNRVCIEFTAHVFFRAVIDCRMFDGGNIRLLYGPRISRVFIRHDHVHVLRDVLLNVLRQCAALGVLSVEESQIAIALTDSNDNFFCSLASVDALADLLSTDVGFIHFANAVHLWLADLLNSMTNAMAEIPRRAIVNFQHSVKLMRGHAFFRLANQVHGEEPLRERQMSVMEHCASRYRELVAA